MGDVTLDIAEVQILINYPLDGDGLFWHHRILLCRIENARWMTLTPDHEIQQHDLGVERHVVLERMGQFPAHLAAEVYAHDPIGKAALSAFKRQAQTMAIILGQGDLPDTEASTWVVADLDHQDFGKIIDSAVLQNAATGLAFGSKGVIMQNGEEIYVERVLTRELESWRKKKKLDNSDVRLLGDHRDGSGRKRLDLSTAVSLMRDSTDPDFPIFGTKAAREFHLAVSEGPGNFVSYHTEWLRLSGVSRRSSAAHVHQALCEGLRLLHQYDQVDSSGTAIGEHLTRWLIQTEIAVERNPMQPDYQGLDVIAGTSTMQDGRANTNKFNDWVSSKMKERASIWKQERLFRQERRNQMSRGGRQGDDDDDDSDEEETKGGGKAKKKKKKPKSKPGNDNPGTPNKWAPEVGVFIAGPKWLETLILQQCCMRISKSTVFLYIGNMVILSLCHYFVRRWWGDFPLMDRYGKWMLRRRPSTTLLRSLFMRPNLALIGTQQQFRSGSWATSGDASMSMVLHRMTSRRRQPCESLLLHVTCIVRRLAPE